jgi:ankyrin repeat protein
LQIRYNFCLKKSDMSNGERCFELLNRSDWESLRRLLEDDPSCAQLRDANGVSLLMQCLYRGRRDIAELIASHRSLDIFEAASLGQLDRFRELVVEKTNINSRSIDGFTALHFACFFGPPESARLLINRGAAVDAVAENAMKVMPLHSAASVRNLEAARILLEHGAPVNARQQGGWVPLHAAASNGDRAMVELLLGHGANAKLANDEGKTAADVAREKGHQEIAALLGQ